MEMNWLFSPTNHMIELVPTRQSGSNGQRLKIMTAKPQADIHMNLPALRKLDSMLLETLDSMVSTEFLYMEVSIPIKEKSIKWCLPSPKVPVAGLSGVSRTKLDPIGMPISVVNKIILYMMTCQDLSWIHTKNVMARRGCICLTMD